MRAKLIQVIDQIFSNDVSRQRLEQYIRLKDEPGWEFHKDILLLIQGIMTNDMLSRQFTDLGAMEKDVRQRAYRMVYEVTMFLMDPMKFSEKHFAIKKYNKSLTPTTGRQNNRKRP
ncbi:MAG: hypothetical protein SWO11_18830 [Thermodesulfobacteriota bacterium]|nr:hypothetical protein [Thermodesulfobacteriota bacterium]